MSLYVKSINGDSTFLLTFSPIRAKSAERYGTNGASEDVIEDSETISRDPRSFTILLDPWLEGDSRLWHPKFLTARRKTTSCIQNLSELPEPDLVIVSQAKSDHCHAATLRQLNPDSEKTVVFAERTAAKAIRAMKHFPPDKVKTIKHYASSKSDSVLRVPIPGHSPHSSAGEVTITHIGSKLDMADVHHAIGITYRAPEELCDPALMIPSPPATPPIHQASPHIPPLNHGENSQALEQDFEPHNRAPATYSPKSNTLSLSHRRMGDYALSESERKPSHDRPRTLSLIYSPHGADSKLVAKYTDTYLQALQALPLTLLLHPFDKVFNPWWLGGNVVTGLPGGLEMARVTATSCWVSAHDGAKDTTGLSVALCKTRHYFQDQVADAVHGSTAVRVLSTGETLKL